MPSDTHRFSSSYLTDPRWIYEKTSDLNIVFGLFYSGIDQFGNLLVINLDSSGKFLNRNFDVKDKNDPVSVKRFTHSWGWYNSIRLKNGNFLTFGSKTLAVSNAEFGDIELLKSDSNGWIVWQAQYPSGNFEYSSKAFKETSDGNIMILCGLKQGSTRIGTMMWAKIKGNDSTPLNQVF